MNSTLILQFFFLAWLSLQDIKTKRISLWLCMALFIVSVPLMLQSTVEQIFAAFIALGGIYLFSLLFQMRNKHSDTSIGLGDYLVLGPLLLTLPLRNWSVFLILSGVLTLLYLKGFQQQKAPLVPFLALSYAVCLFIK